MEKIELFAKLKSWIKVVHGITIAMDLFQAVILVLIGVSFRNILNAENQDRINFWTTVVIIVIVVFVIISVIKLIYNLTFPASIVDELESKIKVKELEKEIGKKRNINQYVVESIASLNSQTCDLSNKIKIDLGKVDASEFEPDYLERIGKFCHKDIGQGMLKCYQPVIDHTADLLSTTASKFTVGLYLDYYYKIPTDGDPVPASYQELQTTGTFILEDKLDFKPLLIHDFMSDSTATDLVEIIQNQINKTLKVKGDKFHSQTLKMQDRSTLTIITSGMPYVCVGPIDEPNENSRGILFIIGKNVDPKTIPKDLSLTLNIFNKIGTNWLDKHDECVENKFPYTNADA